MGKGGPDRGGHRRGPLFGARDTDMDRPALGCRLVLLAALTSQRHTALETT
jgi:hypothetical protein